MNLIFLEEVPENPDRFSSVDCVKTITVPCVCCKSTLRLALTSNMFGHAEQELLRRLNEAREENLRLKQIIRHNGL